MDNGWLRTVVIISHMVSIYLRDVRFTKGNRDDNGAAFLINVCYNGIMKDISK